MPIFVHIALAVSLAAGAGVALAQSQSVPTQAQSKPAQAQPAPFKAGDAGAGKVLVDRDCVGCHAQRFAGDPDQMYKRPDRRVRTPAQLLAQVQGCNANLGKGYFPEEEEHIAAYLNLEFYKFAP